MTNIKKLTALILTGTLVLTFPVYADDEYEKDSISLETKITKINKEGDLILGIGRKDLESLAEDPNGIQLECHFCDKKYHFSQEAVKALISDT